MVELEWPEQRQQYSRDRGLHSHHNLSAKHMLELRSGIYYKAYAWQMQDLLCEFNQFITTVEPVFSSNPPPKTVFTYLELLHEDNATFCGNLAAL